MESGKVIAAGLFMGIHFKVKVEYHKTTKKLWDLIAP